MPLENDGGYEAIRKFEAGVNPPRLSGRAFGGSVMEKSGDRPSLLRRILVRRFIDLRITALSLAIAAASAYALSAIEPRASFIAAFGIAFFAMIIVGISTLFDD